MKNYNILFIFVDSVRTYHSNDDRSRLEIMDEFAEESIECSNVVTSAASTFMSISAMMSGMPSYYINRNYNDFIFDKNTFVSMPEELNKAGYNLYNFWMAPISRETMSSLLPCIDRKFWPKGFKHSEWWSNTKINQLVKSTLQKIEHHKQPNFFFVNYNCRNDPNTSTLVKDNINLFRSYGYSKQNTITILCSDHGYPDPSKDTGNPIFYTLNNVGHDLVLTDDNIMIPFLIQYPNSKISKIKTAFSTIDIFPTILDILGLKIDKNILGKSFLSAIEGNKKEITKHENRFHRCDSRLAFQKGRGTAIRNGRYKYIYYHDNFFSDIEEEFFDLFENPMEDINLINSKNAKIQNHIKKFRTFFNKSEEEAMLFQINFLFKKFRNSYTYDINKACNILVIDSARPIFINLISDLISRINDQVGKYILNIENDRNEFNIKNILTINNKSENLDYHEISNLVLNKKIDLMFVPINTNEGRNNKHLLNVLEKLKIKMILIDYNFHYKNHKISLFNRVEKALKSMLYLIYEPLGLMKYLYAKTKNMISR